MIFNLLISDNVICEITAKNIKEAVRKAKKLFPGWKPPKNPKDSEVKK